MEIIKQLAYSLVDFLSLGKGIRRTICGFTIYFPARWSRYFEKDYESENIHFLKEHLVPGAVVFDVGAHLGLLSVIASQLVGEKGKVYAFEPSPSTFQLLQKVIRLNSVYAPILPQAMALTNQKGVLKFYVSENPGSNSNSLVEKHHLNRRVLEIPCTSLDEFVKEQQIPNVSLIKIDAEGSELQVLLGARELLLSQRPNVILAVHPRLIRNNNNQPLDVFKLISELQYETYYKGYLLNEANFCAIDDFFDVHLTPIKK
jgi:FkbM family methyltransferase